MNAGKIVLNCDANGNATIELKDKIVCINIKTSEVTIKSIKNEE